MFFNKKLFIFTLLLSFSIASFFCTQDMRSPADLVKEDFNTQLMELQEVVDGQLSSSIAQHNEEEIKVAFLRAREKYKSIEYYFEYFFPSTAVMLNGAPIDEIELGENLIENPTGFQVMEELIYEEPNKENRTALANEVKKMQLNLKRAVRFNEQYQLTDAQVFDAMRLEIFRITSLGITGFDTPTALSSIPEAASSLKGVAKALGYYTKEDQLEPIKLALVYLNKSGDFNSFDRLHFITSYLDPISREIDFLRKQHHISTAVSGSALGEETVSMFQPNAFNLDRFVGNSTLFTSPEKVALGKVLFNDVILSNGGNRSCASCHHKELAFSDGLPKAKGITTSQFLLRNTPTLNYAGLQRGFFYDLKAGTLEDQALDVVHHKQEMDGSLVKASERINSSKKYAVLFQNAYGDKKAKADAWKIQHALATYIRSLNSFSSKFDRYMQGDRTQLTQDEKTGFNLFMGKGKCGSCHFAPIFNGTQAPMFSKSEAEVLGVPSAKDTIGAKIDHDLGRYGLYPYPQFKHSFKTPTLRNIDKTAPYMHNGVYQTLEEVMDFYNRGGGAALGINLENQTLSSEKLNLSKVEIKQIIAFLKTLNDQ